MITNNLMIKLKDSSPERIAEAREALLGMRGKIGHIHELKVETDIRSGTYDLMLIVQYVSMADLEAYLVHPVHVKVSEYIAGVILSAASFCYGT
ncbi:Dabb family protein [Paenibacillus sp. MMS20-IR301]|uniref:Dabb family protein n=1 Tax=Paenibacillus sp. MMS20-IR301 TaxID=2895946 RepID=UPI0028F13EB5|nr:Dabb family protein [Paenibacillus sp. MMS20-IR301]WNS44255.1 Dabb family protein [Paenibacillus sp. MMS20-IR301]